jgi:GntR family transcriptional regulator, phosphonate transport system regulatory protein
MAKSSPAFNLPDDPAASLWPLWRQVENGIERAIASGRLTPGDRLPGEHQLAGEFGAHRHTVRRAIDSLTGKGVLETRRGLGTFVAESSIPYTIGRHSRFTANMRAAGRAPGVRILRTDIISADAESRHWLELQPGAQLVRLEIVRTGNDIPIVLTRHDIPAKRFPDFAQRFRERLSITDTFASYDVVGYSRRSTRISARPSSALEARTLALPESVPVLGWISVNVDVDGRPIDLDASVFAASRIDIVLEAGDKV